MRTLLFLAGTVLHAAALAADVVPLTFINNIPFVTVTVGAVSSRLMIDSGGALGLSLPEKTISQSGAVTLLDKKTKFADLHGKVYEVRNFTADPVAVGKSGLGPVDGRVHVQWGGAAEGLEAELTKARAAGAIGLAAFGRRPLVFDYRLGTLAIHAPGEGPQADRQGWQALRLEYGKEGPSVALTVNGKALKFVLDTGAQVNLINAQSVPPGTAASRCPPKTADTPDCDPRDLGQVLDSTGRSLGRLTAERVSLTGAPFDGILGAPFFERYRVLFDLSSHRLLISLYDKPAAGRTE